MPICHLPAMFGVLNFLIMKRHLALLVFTILSLSNASAQSITVEVLLDSEQFIVGEAINAQVRITNFSGQTLQLGSEDDWLTFALEGGPRKVVSQRSLVPAKGEFSLDSSKKGTRTVNIEPSFDLSRPGRYKLTASVRIPKLNSVVQCEPKSFNIINGTMLWQQEFGLPSDPIKADTAPEFRRYTLLQVTKQKELVLYFRLSEAAGERVQKVFPIGALVSVSTPQGQLDKYNNLHLLYQYSARGFSYLMINPDGVILSRETHELVGGSRPGLRPDDDGRINVSGGVRRYTSTDLPPSTISEATTASAPEAKTPEAGKE